MVASLLFEKGNLDWLCDGYAGPVIHVMPDVIQTLQIYRNRLRRA